MNWEFERYKRQWGLVHQRRVIDLNILVLGVGPALPYLVTNLALVGVGTLTLPANSAPVTAAQVAGQFLLRASDVGAPLDETLARRVGELNPHTQVKLVDHALDGAYDALVVTDAKAYALPAESPIIWAGVTSYGVYVGARKPASAPFTPNLLTPALASLCGALSAQEALRVTHCLRDSEIQKCWVTLNYAFREPASAELKFALDGTPIAATNDQRDGELRLHRVPINLSHDLVRHLVQEVSVDEPSNHLFTTPTECLYYSPIWGNRLENNCVLEKPLTLPALGNQRVVLGGIGGLGTWVAALLAASELSGELVVFDNDTQVETHNLNRQVLYTEHALGESKVFAATRALEHINPTLTITALLEEIQATTAITRAELMAHTQLALSTFDNFRARYVLGEWAALHGVPLINGGADGFNGDVELIAPAQHGCLFCRWEQTRGLAAAQVMSTDEAHLSCTREDANAPDVGTALVTTTAAIASWQTLLALLTLAQPVTTIDHQLGYLGKENALEKCRLADPCPQHNKGTCTHPREFWQTLEETLHGDNS